MNNSGFGERLIQRSKSVYRRISPKRIHFPAAVYTLLKQIYPNLETSMVRFYEGLPWFIDQGFAQAIALPGVYNVKGIHIYFSKVDLDSRQGIATVVHECFHALQYQELYKSRGVGLFRLFMVHYLAEFFALFIKNFRKSGLASARQQAYEQHVMEVPAFEMEYRFMEFAKHCDEEQLLSVPIPDELVIRHSGHEYKAGRMPYWSSALLLIILTLIAPFAELLLLIYAGVCFVLGKAFSLLGI